MKSKQFDKMANEAFGKILIGGGFTSEKSKYCTFYREVSDGFFHVILPDLGTYGEWYDVKVFAYSSLIDPQFPDIFPDSIGIPTDSYCYLAPSGIGLDYTQFNCKNVERFTRRFDSTVVPLLRSVAIPYLDQFQNLSDFLPQIVNPLRKAIATYYVHGASESQSLLKEQERRLADINSSDEVIISNLKLIKKLLSKSP